jgi:Tc toxin complex TcA C-terminal TcB-binding domain
MAHEAASRAEVAANFELGLSEREKLSHIRLDNWEPGRKGLLAAERLRQQLRRLDEAFLEKDTRTLELTKHVSLAQIDPMALAFLKSTGSCTFDVPEIVFDLDHAGHFLRRIKAVSLTIPCVVGPYGSVSARLELKRSWVRLTDTIARDDMSMDFWKPDVDSIATSSAQQDAGVFELNFHDERLLPFEGAGVISRWKLDLPHGAEGTPAIRQFDYQTISDVVLHFQYTAREGSGSRDLVTALNAFALPEGSSGDDDRRPPLKRVLSMAQEFGTEWYRFLQPSPGAPSDALTIQLSKRLFPYIFDALDVTITATSVCFVDGAGALTPLIASAAPTRPTVERSEQPFAVLTRDQLASGPSTIRDCLAVLCFSVTARRSA